MIKLEFKRDVGRDLIATHECCYFIIVSKEKDYTLNIYKDGEIVKSYSGLSLHKALILAEEWINKDFDRTNRAIKHLTNQIESLKTQLNKKEFQTRLINKTIEEYEYLIKMLSDDSE